MKLVLTTGAAVGLHLTAVCFNGTAILKRACNRRFRFTASFLLLTALEGLTATVFLTCRFDAALGGGPATLLLLHTAIALGRTETKDHKGEEKYR